MPGLIVPRRLTTYEADVTLPRGNLNVTGGHRYIECNQQVQITGMELPGREEDENPWRKI